MQMKMRRRIRMIDIFKVYSLACVFLPCVACQIVFVFRSRRRGKGVSAVWLSWLNVFLLYLWMVFDVTGVGTMGDILRNRVHPIIAGL